MNRLFRAALPAALGLLSACGPSAEGHDALAWALDDAAVWRYAYAQRASSRTYTTLATGPGGAPQYDTSAYRTQAEGTLLVATEGDGRASWSLEDVVLTAVNLGADGVPVDSGSQPIPPMTSAVRDARGFLLEAMTEEEALFPYLFPLPSVDLEPGASITDSIALPMPALGVPLPLTGRRTITHAGTEERGGAACIRLEVAYTVEATDLPPEFQGNYVMTRTGSGTGWFNRQEGRYEESDVRLSSTVAFDAGPGIGTMRVESTDRFTVVFAGHGMTP
jgi:hypothetical protein